MTPKQRDILLIPVPFTDLHTIKRRPVLVLSNDNYNKSSDDILVAAITSNLEEKHYSVRINAFDVFEGTLKRTSVVRTDKIYTLNKRIVLKRFGKLKLDKYSEVISAIHKLIE